MIKLFDVHLSYHKKELMKQMAIKSYLLNMFIFEVSMHKGANVYNAR